MHLNSCGAIFRLAAAHAYQLLFIWQPR